MVTTINATRTTYKTLNEILLQHEESIKAESILIGSHKSVTPYTYADVVKLSDKVVRALQKMKIKKGDRVLIILPTSIEFVCSFFGVLLAGGVPVPIAPGNIGFSNLTYYLERTRGIIKDCKAKFAILDEKQIGFNPLRETLEAFEYLTIININELEPVAESVSGPLSEGPEYVIPDIDDICFLQYTSGSTGSAKGVPITHRNLFVNIAALAKTSLITSDSFLVSWMPLYHDMGMIVGLLSAVYNGIPILLFPAELFIFKPILWFKFISDYKATISLGNNFSLNYCLKKITDEELKGLNLSSWRVLYNGSEPINMDVVNDFYRKFKCTGYKEETMLPSYGLAEGTVGVALAPATDKPVSLRVKRDSIYAKGIVEIAGSGDLENSIELVSVGAPISDVEVKIADAQGNELAEGHVGEILIKGPSVMSGYYNNHSQEKNKYFKGDWFCTGDLGFFYNYDLYIAGRKKELIIIRGKNFSPIDIENTILKKQADKTSACIAFSYPHPEKREEVLAVVYESKTSSEDFLIEMKESIENIVLSEFSIRVNDVIQTARIPKTLNGKIMRTDCYPRYILERY